MKIVFRVDASIQIGTGHVMRCLTLAKELKQKGNEVLFISRNLNGNLFDLITREGYQVFCLQTHHKMENNCENKHAQWLETSWEIDAEETTQIIKKNIGKADWLVIDHYAIDYKWENELKDYSKYIMVIDDLADRKHKCDLLLDQNYYSNMYKRYHQLVPTNCKLLLGPKYALLRDEFIENRKILNRNNRKLQNILVFFGGTDPTNETLKTIRALNKIENKLNIDVVVGASNPKKREIREITKRMENTTFHSGIDYMAKLMVKADLAICAGGTTTWERYCLGLPAILIAVAFNQIEICEAISELEIDRYMGESKNITELDIINAVADIHHLNRKQSVEIALKTVDGWGKFRVIEEILK